MYCPKCKSEYVDGITRCPDCDVDLVEELPDKKKRAGDPDIKFVSIITSSDLGLIAIAKSILEEENIDYFTQGEGFNNMFNPITGPIDILVREEDEQNARDFLQELIEENNK